jgi:arylsulfatase A-like enzyme
LLIKRYKTFDYWTGKADTTGWLTNVLCDRLKTKRKRPFFIWAHYMDPHVPLTPPIKYVLDKSPFKEKGKAFTEKRIKRRMRYTKANKDMLISLYRAEVEYVDDSLGEVFRTLEEEGLLDNTLVIITADHGEEHFEHGRYGHTKTHYTEVMSIPLIIRALDVAPAICDYPVSLVDLMPTVLSYTGAGIPDEVSGRDILYSVGTESVQFEKRVVFFDQSGECNPVLKSIYISPYILTRRGNEGYRYDFIDTRRMKEAPEDIIENPPAELFAQYKTALEAWIKVIEEESATLEKSEEIKLSAFEREQLKALGYF